MASKSRKSRKSRKLIDAFNTELALVDSGVDGDLYLYMTDHDRNTNEVMVMTPRMQAILIERLAAYMAKSARKRLH